MPKFKFSKTNIDKDAKPHPTRDTFYWDIDRLPPLIADAVREVQDTFKRLWHWLLRAPLL